MKLHAIELRRVQMPLVRPFRTSYGVEAARDVLLVRALSADGDGWGECVAGTEPRFSAEYVDGAHAVIRAHLIPRLFAAGGEITAAGVAAALRDVCGHRMAKAAVELAVLDAELRGHELPLHRYLGAEQTRVPAGVSIGIAATIPDLLTQVDGYLAEGYLRIKLKIQPGWDLEPVRAVRKAFASIPLQVDANTAYTRADAGWLARLDEFGLSLIEQPLGRDDLTGHAALARILRTPICLDESIVSASSAAQAIGMGACTVVNIKAGRVGGYLEARRVHDVCAALGVPVWCGGMLETGIGRAANLALAALPNCRLPGDTSASDRYWARDLITEPFRLDDGHIKVPAGPGLGVLVDMAAVRTRTISVEEIRP